jgi:hypothetical protein
MVIHHFRKQNMQHGVVRPGQRIMGSATLHGWVDSALYLESLADRETRDGYVRVGIEKEFRSMAPQRGMELALAMGSPGSLEMSVEMNSWSIETLLVDIVSAEPGVTVVELAKRLSKDKRTILQRCRGTELLAVKEATAGRGKSHKVYLAGAEA